MISQFLVVAPSCSALGNITLVILVPSISHHPLLVRQQGLHPLLLMYPGIHQISLLVLVPDLWNLGGNLLLHGQAVE